MTKVRVEETGGESGKSSDKFNDELEIGERISIATEFVPGMRFFCI